MTQIITNNGGGGGGEGDMKKSVYDPNNVSANAFDYDNFINTPTIPTDNSELTNGAGYITGISSGDVTTALGYTPYNSTNPSGYVNNTIINDTAYGSSWDGDTTHSPTKNAVYDKLNSMDTAISGNTTDISTINGKIPSAATSSNQLADKDYVNDSINSITAYYITKNAQGDQFATYAELSSATTFYSGGVARVPTRNDYCIVQADENHDNATTRYIYQNNQWEYQYTVNETALTTAQLNALNSGITSGKVSTYDGYASTIAGKQDTLSAGTGISISSNTVSNTGVTSVNSNTGAVTVSEFSPSGTATTGYVVTKTAGGYEWAAPSGGSEIVYATQAEYTALLPGAASDGKHYFIYTASSRLPSAYQEVEYIQGTGSGGASGTYIDTGFKPNNNTRYVVEYEKADSRQAPIGCWNNPASYGLIIIDQYTHYATELQDTSGLNVTNTKLLADFNKNEFYLNEVLKNTFTVDTFQMNINAWLFCWNRNGEQSNNYGNIKIWSAKIYDDGTLVRDFVPCYRIADSVIGMYDLVNDVFYTNSGTGTFTKGNDV